ncbi:MAG TPA: hypothetical protein VK524_22395 [Polyangiaceae bacterium]|nr:hypothetical protein [Polyangiaceae bacterium]
MKPSVIALIVALGGCNETLLVAEEPADRIDDAGGSSAQDAASDAASVYLVCGETRCYNRTAMTDLRAVEFFACCADPGASRCGLITDECVALDQPGTLDPRCPDVDILTFGTLPGCCTPNGKCGWYETKFGFGCSPSPLAQLVDCPDQ